IAPHTSKIELYSSSGNSYDVLIGPNHVPAIATGQGGGSFSASVSREAGINVGDEVTLSSVPNNQFAIVSAVIANPAEPFEKVFFAEPINPYELSLVLINMGSRSLESLGQVSTTSIK
ncbi:MAG: hypothetical protein KGJ35_02840, partial [Patescibacteria group bacterium]|nr:hypothetical protein [Patescibacteria group bacterium]